MTMQPPAPDWYPDPTGRPGARYWDGQRWHAEVPATESPAEQPPAQTNFPAAQPQRPAALTAALWATAVVVVGLAGFSAYLLLNRSHPAAPATAPISVPTVPAAAPPTQAPPPPPSYQYIRTTIGRRCRITAETVNCEVCNPGDHITNAYTCTDPPPGIAVNSAGVEDTNPPSIGASPDIQKVSSGQSYHAIGWTIVGDGGWTRFTNDATGHGMAVAAQNRYTF
jgi:hypothetical protein